MVQWCNVTLECEEKESEEVSRHVSSVAVLYTSVTAEDYVVVLCSLIPRVLVHPS